MPSLIVAGVLYAAFTPAIASALFVTAFGAHKQAFDAIKSMLDRSGKTDD